MTDADGQPAPAFAPHLREGSATDGAVSALLQVPARGRARAALPLFADDALLDADAAAEGRWMRWITVTPLGASAPLYREQVPLTVSRGSTAAALGLLGTLLAAVLGGGLLLVRGRRWLVEIPTSGLMTIALFGSMTFMVSAAGRLLSTVVSGLLGPFSVLLTSLVDDLFRYALMATLLSLLPRVGTASLALVTSWLLGGLVFGSFGPGDLLSLGSQIGFAETCLWLAGITRGRGWLSESARRRWLRLSLGFGSANLLGTASSLVLQMVLYRLYFADWFVALLLAGPGAAYVGLACAFAVPFADSMRQVQR